MASHMAEVESAIRASLERLRSVPCLPIESTFIAVCEHQKPSSIGLGAARICAPRLDQEHTTITTPVFFQAGGPCKILARASASIDVECEEARHWVTLTIARYLRVSVVLDFPGCLDTSACVLPLSCVPCAPSCDGAVPFGVSVPGSAIAGCTIRIASAAFAGRPLQLLPLDIPVIAPAEALRWASDVMYLMDGATGIPAVTRSGELVVACAPHPMVVLPLQVEVYGEGIATRLVAMDTEAVGLVGCQSLAMALDSNSGAIFFGTQDDGATGVHAFDLVTGGRRWTSDAVTNCSAIAALPRWDILVTCASDEHGRGGTLHALRSCDGATVAFAEVPFVPACVAADDMSGLVFVSHRKLRPSLLVFQWTGVSLERAAELDGSLLPNTAKDTWIVAMAVVPQVAGAVGAEACAHLVVVVDSAGCRGTAHVFSLPSLEPVLTTRLRVMRPCDYGGGEAEASIDALAADAAGTCLVATSRDWVVRFPWPLPTVP